MGLTYIVSLLSAAFLAIVPLTASPPDEPNSTDSPTVTFIAVEDATFPEVLKSLNESNPSEDVAAFLSAQADDPSPELEELGLTDVPIESAREMLDDAAAVAAEDAGVDPGDDSPQAFSDPTHVALMAPASFSASGPAVKMSIDTAGVAGEAINNRFSWKRSDRAYLRECNGWSCWANSWLDWRVVTDPGKNNTRTNVQFLKGGEGKLGAVRLRTVVLSSGRNISSTTARWNANVSGQNQWNSNHQSTQGRNFQMYYKLDFIGPNNLTSSYEFKSRITGACNDPYPAAYRCLF